MQPQPLKYMYAAVPHLLQLADLSVFEKHLSKLHSEQRSYLPQSVPPLPSAASRELGYPCVQQEAAAAAEAEAVAAEAEAEAESALGNDRGAAAVGPGNRPCCRHPPPVLDPHGPPEGSTTY